MKLLNAFEGMQHSATHSPGEAKIIALSERLLASFEANLRYRENPTNVQIP
jgi:hypothetical protein